MNNSIKIDEKEAYKLYELLLNISSRLSLLSSLDNEILYNSEFIQGIKHTSNSINQDVKECIKLTNI